MIDGSPYKMEYPVKDAFWAEGRAIVLLDPDAFLTDSAYKKARRRGDGAIRNLLALARNGTLLWQAALPESVDYYYKLENRNPLIALSFSSYRCEIDPFDGHIAMKQFLK
jgi:hypothetical protein